MSTIKQKAAARRNLEKARSARSARAATKRTPPQGLSTAQKNDLPKSKFAFEAARKEPLTDAEHVRNAIARFDQVEDVTDAERDRAWTRILAAANKYDIEVEADDWRELVKGGNAKKP